MKNLSVNHIHQVIRGNFGWQIEQHENELVKISYLENGELCRTNFIEGIHLDAAKELAKIILTLGETE